MYAQILGPLATIICLAVCNFNYLDSDYDPILLKLSRQSVLAII